MEFSASVGFIHKESREVVSVCLAELSCFKFVDTRWANRIQKLLSEEIACVS